MNAGQMSAAIVQTAPVLQFSATVPVEAANDASPARRPVTLPAGVSLAGRRDRAMSVDISTDVVTVRPSAAMAVAAPRPLSSFRGVAVTVRRGEIEPVFNLSLLHENPRLSIPLSTGTEAAAVAREWQAWAKALDLPLIAVEADGTVHAELTALGVVLAERPSPRRKGSPLVGRRSIVARRRRDRTTACPADALRTFAGEREIIART